MIIWWYMSLSIAFKLYQDDGMVAMKGSVQRSAVQSELNSVSTAIKHGKSIPQSAALTTRSRDVKNTIH